MAIYHLPRGTQDFLFERTLRLEYIESVLRDLAESYGYAEIRTPIFEHTEVFLRSVGESSDIVNKEMYTFTSRGERSLTLRPEGTAGVIRAFVEQKEYAQQDYPYKAFYLGPVFRYERPQAGRYRQLHQFGVESIGTRSPYLDAEVILMACHMLNELGIHHYRVKINSIGDESSLKRYREALQSYFAPAISTLCEDCHRRLDQNALRILDCKLDGDKEIVKNAPKISDFLSDESQQYFSQTLQILNDYQVPYVVDDRLVRGLDYYTDVVFEIEAEDHEGHSFGAICGGGRYDRLVKEFDGPELPAAGFAFGMERLLLLLEKDELLHSIVRELETYVMPLEDKVFQYAFDVMMHLRLQGIQSDMDYGMRSIKAQFKTVDRKHAQYAILIGTSEMEQQSVTVKSNTTKEQKTMPVDELVPYLAEQFATREEEHTHTCDCGHDDHDCCHGEGDCHHHQH